MQTSPLRDVVGLSGEPHQPALHLDAHIKGQQQVQPSGPAGHRLCQGQQSGQHRPRGMSGGVPGVVKVHGVNLMQDRAENPHPKKKEKVTKKNVCCKPTAMPLTNAA